MNTTPMIGQRVIIKINGTKEIGTVVPSESGQTNFGAWVYSPSKKYASDYALCNIEPLPKGQL